MEDDTLDLFADMDQVNDLMMGGDIEFYYESGNMSCPIHNCNPNLKFVIKEKWQRHWEERHVLENIKYICAVATCHAECRRRTDMRAHIILKHERNPVRAEDILAKCPKKFK